MAGYVPGTGSGDTQAGSKALRSEWDAEFRSQPDEEMVIGPRLSKPQGVEKIGDTLYIRIVPRIPRTTLSGTTQGSGSISYTVSSITRVAATPTFGYGAIEIPAHELSKMRKADASGLRAEFRKKLKAGIAAAIDADCGTNLANFSTSLGLPSNLDQSLMLAAKALLTLNARDFVKFYGGTPRISFIYHPTQMQYIDAIPGITHAYATGRSGASPTMTGVVHEAWGMQLAETGNIYTAAGAAYNLMMTPDAGVLGWNLEPHVKDVQYFELVERWFSEGEAASVEVFDEAGVMIKSPY